MIKYNLICKCGNSFESWFANSTEFDSLFKKKMVKCIYCESSSVKKTLMAPSLKRKSNQILKKRNNQILLTYHYQANFNSWIQTIILYPMIKASCFTELVYIKKAIESSDYINERQEVKTILH